MPLAPTLSYHERRRLCGEELLALLAEHGSWELEERRATDGPARRYRRKEDGMRVGIIDPLGPRFCENCNRVRITARGELRNCLFGLENVLLRPCLEGDDWESRLEETLRRAILDKPEKHRLELLDTGRLDSLVRVGG
jgi:cyclic pyranopterin phosphate synthase